MSRYMFSAIAWLLLAGAVPAQAADSALPVAGGVQPGFSGRGTIDALDLAGLTIVVNDRTFRLSSRLRVMTASGLPASAASLRAGLVVGYARGEGDGAERVIEAIWILAQR